MARNAIHTVTQTLRRRTLQAAIAFTAAAALAVPTTACAQALTQVPFGSIYVGIAASTYSGTNGQPCTSLNPNYLDFLGDGCPATQATLAYPYGVSLDSYNNLAVAEYTNFRIRVVYQGNPALAAALIAANPTFNFAPTPGSVYPIGSRSSALTSVSGVYYCNNLGTGPTALNKAGDGCPAQSAYIQPRAVAFDKDGNIFIGSIYPFQCVRVFYVGGAATAKLITTFNPSVTAPQPGYIYPLSVSGDFVAIRDLGIDPSGNIYAADNGAQAAATGLAAATTGLQIKKFNGTGWATYLLGSTSATPAGADGDGGPASAASFNSVAGGAFGMFVDTYGNVYFADTTDVRIRVVYNGGITPPLYVQGANSTVVTNPVVGNVYSVAGGGTARTSGSLGSALNLNASATAASVLSSFGVDNSGNLIVTDSANTTGTTWRVDQRTGVAVIIGGAGANSSTFSAAATPGPGVACNGATGGPLMTDAFASGCPATEIAPYKPYSHVVFDPAGNYYQVEQRVTAQNAGIVRRYSYNTQLGAVAVGSTAATTVAFTPANGVAAAPTQSYVLTGDATAEFSDGSGALCSLSGTALVQTCTYNVNFKPTLAGPRLGAITLSAAGVNLASAPIGGIGTAAQLTLDPAAQATVGTGLAPSGTTVDQGGVAYIADNSTGNLYKSVNGGAPTQVATGFKNPGQIAVDGSGNVFVTDTGNNRVAIAVNVSVPTAEANALAALTLSGPTGIAADLSGNLYIADTGGNRVVMISQLGGSSVKPFTGLTAPHSLAIDAAGDIFVADTGNARIVELPAAVAGNQPAQIALTVSPSLISPVGLAVDPAGNLYIADSTNQNVVLLPAGTTTATTLVGGIGSLTGVAADTTGDVFISATSLTGLLELNRTKTSYTFQETNLGQTTQQLLRVNSTGNLPLVLGSTLGTGTDATDFSTGTATTGSCSTGQSLNGGQSCAVLATFKPQSKASLASTVTFASNAADAASIQLIGTGVQKIATTTAVTYITTAGGQPIAGQAFTVKATITPATNGGAIAGSVSFSVDGGVPTSQPVNAGVAQMQLTLAAGSHTIVATYSGDTNYTASSGALSVVAVAPAGTTTTLTFNPAPPGNAVAFTVTATITSGASQGAIGGTIAFTVNGTTPVQSANGTVTNGVATAQFTLPTGKYTITANYSGTPYYIASTVTTPVQVVPAGTSTTKLTLTSPTGGVTYGQTVVVAAALTTGNATATPTGTVTFTVDGNLPQTFNYATALSATFTGLPAGAHIISATYGGDNAYGPSTGTLPLTIARATPSAVLTVTPNVAATGNSFVVTAAVSSPISPPSGTVTMTVAGATYGPTQLTNGVATFLIPTNVLSAYSFSASYAGDSNFTPVTFTANPKTDFVAVLQSPTVTTPQYGVALDYVSVNSFYNYTGTVTLSCAGLPANTICRSTPINNPITANGNTSVQLQIFTNIQPVATASLEDGRTRTVEFALSLGFLLMLPMLRFRRRFAKAITLAILLCASLAAVSGCGSDTHDTNAYITPLGTYPITITATDGTITHTVNLSLTVVAGTRYNP